MQKFAEKRTQIIILFNAIPGYIVGLFCVSVVGMNLLANKSIGGLPEWLALDCGFLLSWMSFLCMDTITKHFGPKASIYTTIFALLVNLIMVFIFFCASSIPGVWSSYYDFGETEVINEAVNHTFGVTWYILLGSSVAFLVSSIVNSTTNHLIGRRLKEDNFKSFSIRSYISTAIGQFVDNLIFALMVSHIFFGWSLTQCITCAITGMLIELACEVVFSPIGYKIASSWKRNNVGQEYISKYFN